VSDVDRTGGGVFRQPSAGGAGAIARSIRAMTIGTLQSYNQRRATYEGAAIGEVDQQYQLALTGQVERDAKWIEQVVIFDTPFINGTEERDVPFLYPHFTFGSVVTKGKNFVVACNVLQWQFDPESEGEFVVGATDFAIEVHLNFEGWAGMNAPEDPENDGSGSPVDLTDTPLNGDTGA
jgi:hypothetical protein